MSKAFEFVGDNIGLELKKTGQKWVITGKNAQLLDGVEIRSLTRGVVIKNTTTNEYEITNRDTIGGPSITVVYFKALKKATTNGADIPGQIQFIIENTLSSNNTDTPPEAKFVTEKDAINGGESTPTLESVDNSDSFAGGGKTRRKRHTPKNKLTRYRKRNVKK